MLQTRHKILDLKRPVASLHLSRNSHQLTLGIRKEDSARLWERRCPLTPGAVEELVKDVGVRVLVQSCDRRVFSAHEFAQAGARIQENLSAAHIILGIKEIPLSELKSLSPCSDTHRTHLMFSHTGKGQPYNMPLLSHFAETKANGSLNSTMATPFSRLIDYEFLTDGPGGKRAVAFGWFAGAAGVVEGLCATAHDFLSFGVASPFLHLPRPYMCRSVEGMRQALRTTGSLISEQGTPTVTGPFVVCVTGNGNVATGALSILQELPHKFVTPQELPIILTSENPDLKKIYILHARPEHYLVPTDSSGKPFDRASYYSHPSEWKSVFHEKIAPYVTLLINGAGWQPGFPRLMTNEQLFLARQQSFAFSPHARFRTVADVSCDVKGGLEFLERATTIDSPFYVGRPDGHGPSFSGIQIMSIDILPTQIPRDASEHFSNSLMPYLRTLIRQYQGILTNEDTDRLQALDRATIAQEGRLYGAFKTLTKPLQAFRGSTTPSATVKNSLEGAPRSFHTLKKKVLLLGSGMVARPAIEEFCKRGDIQLVVASNNVSEAEFLREFPSIVAKKLDLSDHLTLQALIDEANIVVSLLPAPFHPIVAKHCLSKQKHMVTASYISPEMRQLHASALERDILLLNEIGLDPGIDHCSAIAMLERFKKENKIVKSFISFCGGLPSPEAAEVPLRYKFSWSPRGVLNATLNSARFKLAGQEYNIDSNNLLSSRFRSIPLSSVFNFEGIANRDSVPYAETYDLGPVSHLDTVLRGTLRYPGFSSVLQSFKQIGLLALDKPLPLNDWLNFSSRALAAKHSLVLRDRDVNSFNSALRDVSNLSDTETQELVNALDFLGIYPSTRHPLSLPLPSRPIPPIDLLTMVLAHRLRYESNERDMVILTHEMTTVPSGTVEDSASKETHTSTLITYGTQTASAMARTVGLPVAFATLSILDGVVSARGVCGPMTRDIYKPVLREMEASGLRMIERLHMGGGSSNLLRSALKGY